MRIRKFLVVGILAFGGFASGVPVLRAGQDFKMHDGFRDKRYGEIVVVTGGPFQFVGHVYNTVGLNDCPEVVWEKLDPKMLAKENRARTVILNGPRYFMMDEIALQNPGPVKTFQGLQARLLAEVKLSIFTVFRGKSKPYTENTVERTSRYVFKKGRPVFELTSPNGKVYVMQTYALIKDKSLTAEQLPDLGSKLALPKGWKYAARVLDEDLVMTTSGTAEVLQDDLFNSYQLLEGSDGGGGVKQN